MPIESNTPESSSNGQAGATAASATAPATGALSGLAREFHNFLGDIEDLIKAATSLGGDDLAKAKSMLTDRLAAARGSVDEMGGAMAQQARRTAAVTDEYVHQQPWAAIGVGVAAGFLLGVMLARRP